MKTMFAIAGVGLSATIAFVWCLRYPLLFAAFVIPLHRLWGESLLASSIDPLLLRAGFLSLSAVLLIVSWGLLTRKPWAFPSVVLASITLPIMLWALNQAARPTCFLVGPSGVSRRRLDPNEGGACRLPWRELRPEFEEHLSIYELKPRRVVSRISPEVWHAAVSGLPAWWADDTCEYFVNKAELSQKNGKPLQPASEVYERCVVKWRRADQAQAEENRRRTTKALKRHRELVAALRRRPIELIQSQIASPLEPPRAQKKPDHSWRRF